MNKIKKNSICNLQEFELRQPDECVLYVNKHDKKNPLSFN